MDRQRSSAGLHGHPTTITPSGVSVSAGTIGRCHEDPRIFQDLQSCAGEAGRVSLSGCPETGSHQGVRVGVWLFFENSTGCLISQCQLVCCLGLLSVVDGVVWVFLWQQVFVVAGVDCSTGFCWRV